jgi:hypothetical protein
MAMGEQSLDRVLTPGVVEHPVSIGPRQAEREKDESRKERRRRPSRPSIEETLDEEQALREDVGHGTHDHIDYHA